MRITDKLIRMVLLRAMLDLSPAVMWRQLHERVYKTLECYQAFKDLPERDRWYRVVGIMSDECVYNHGCLRQKEVFINDSRGSVRDLLVSWADPRKREIISREVTQYFKTRETGQ